MARGRRASAKTEDYELFDDEESFDDQPSSPRTRSRQLIQDILLRWHWIALGLVLGLLGGFYYLSKAPKMYHATSTLFVKQGTSNVITDGRSQDPELDLRSTDALNTVAARIKTADLLTAVAQEPAVLKLEGLLPPKVNWFPEWSHQWLGGPPKEPAKPSQLDSSLLGQIIGSWTSVSVRKGTRLLDITVEHPVPEIASMLADTIIKKYEEELGKTRSDGQDSSSKVLNDEAKDAERILEQKENALANYQIILASLKALEEKEKIFSELDRRYLHKHPKLIEAKSTLEAFRKRFLSEFESVRKAEADREYWEKNRPEWDNSELDDNARLQVARRLLTARATVLTSGIESQKGVYNALVTRKLETDVNKEDLQAEVEVSEYSRVPSVPSSPKKMTTLMGGSVFGIGAGFVLAFLLVKLDNKIHTVLQAESLTGLPVLATIRDIQPKILAKIISEKGTSSNSLPAAARKWDPRIVFRPGLSETLYAEMFRILRASVTLLGDESKRNITLFSSALPGEGKTLVSTNFAIASAQQGKKTLLLDLDLRKPDIHKAFGFKRSQLEAGVTEVLAGKTGLKEAISTDTGQENLFCLFAGTKAPNPGELLNSDSISELLEKLEKVFDVIVIDSAPLLAVPDTRLLIPTADNFCLVVRAEQTPKGAVQKALALLEDDGVEPAGIVINGYEEKAGLLTRKYRYGYGYGGYGQYGKGYGYGSYGSYGSDEDDD